MCTGAISQRDAIAGRSIGIGGIQVNFARSSRGQQNSFAGKRDHLAGLFVQRVQAESLVLLASGLNWRVDVGTGDDINPHMIGIDFDIRFGADGFDQGAFDFPAGEVVGMQDATLGMSPFLCQMKTVLPLGAGKPGSQLDQFPDAGGSFADNTAHHVFLTQAAPGFDGIGHMEVDRIVLCHDRGDPSLGVAGGRLFHRVLGNQGHGAIFGNFQGKGEAGKAATNDYVIPIDFHTRHYMDLGL